MKIAVYRVAEPKQGFDASSEQYVLCVNWDSGQNSFWSDATLYGLIQKFKERGIDWSAVEVAHELR